MHNFWVKAVLQKKTAHLPWKTVHPPRKTAHPPWKTVHLPICDGKHYDTDTDRILYVNTDTDSDSLSLHTQLKQECFPVGCVPTTAVPATRCQYQRGLTGGGGSTWRGRVVCLEGEGGLSRRGWLKTLPSLAVGNKGNFSFTLSTDRFQLLSKFKFHTWHSSQTKRQ